MKIKLYIDIGGRENNDMALKENNSNEEPIIDAVDRFSNEFQKNDLKRE